MKDELTLRFENANTLYSIPTNDEIYEYEKNKDNLTIKYIIHVLKERFFIEEEDIRLIQLMPFSHKKNSEVDEAVDLEKTNADTIKIWITNMSDITKEYLATWNNISFDGIHNWNIYMINGEEYDGLLTYYRYVMSDIIDYIKYNPRLPDTTKEWALPIIGARFLNERFSCAVMFPKQILYSVLREVYHVHDHEYDEDMFNLLMQITKDNDNIQSIIDNNIQNISDENHIGLDDDRDEMKYTMVFDRYISHGNKRIFKTPTLENVCFDIFKLVCDKDIKWSDKVTVGVDLKFNNRSSDAPRFTMLFPKRIYEAPCIIIETSVITKDSYYLNIHADYFIGSSKVRSYDTGRVITSYEIESDIFPRRVAKYISDVCEKVLLYHEFNKAVEECKKIRLIDATMTIEWHENNIKEE